MRWLSRIFNRNACVYQRILDEIYRLIELLFEWLIDDAMFVGLLDEFDSRFFVTAIWHGKPVDLNSHRLSTLYYKWTDWPSVLVDKTQFQSSKTRIRHYKSKIYPNKFWSRKIAQQYSQRKEMQYWVMSLGEDQITAQQKNTFKHNSNCKNQK